MVNAGYTATREMWRFGNTFRRPAGMIGTAGSHAARKSLQTAAPGVSVNTVPKDMPTKTRAWHTESAASGIDERRYQRLLGVACPLPRSGMGMWANFGSDVRIEEDMPTAAQRDGHVSESSTRHELAVRMEEGPPLQ